MTALTADEMGVFAHPTEHHHLPSTYGIAAEVRATVHQHPVEGGGDQGWVHLAITDAAYEGEQYISFTAPQLRQLASLAMDWADKIGSETSMSFDS